MILIFRFFAYNVEETFFKSFFVLTETILFPGVVKYSSIVVVSLHALLEKAYTCAIVGLLLKLKGAAVLHVLTEFAWVPSA